MSKVLTFILVALASVACGAEGNELGQPQQAAETESSTTSVFNARVLAPNGNRAATGLQAAPDCDGGSDAVVHLSWKPAKDPGRAQKVAATQFADGFETGRFTTSPRLAAGISKHNWTGTTANGSYRWRILTKHGSWVGSKISSFIGPSCGVEDYG